LPTKKRQPDIVCEPIMRSAAMKRTNLTLRAVADKDVALTLVGESGTGKEVLARRAHDLSGRRRNPFVPINCAAIPESLFESELFGHERGAFTGANDRVRGKVEAAEGGTLFLDEIGEMPFAMQAKLLRFLENRRFMRVGGSTKLQADVRLMFATLRPLADDVRTGRFREDLFYRIQGITLNVPPLRERKADIAPLLSQFLSQLSALHAVEPPRLNRRVRALLLHYDWPGNVRELRNVTEALCLLRGGRQVRPSDLPEAVRAGVTGDDGGALVSPAALVLQLDEGLDALVRRIIETALELENGSTTRAAARLKVSQRTLQRHIASGSVRARSR
jgi:transcriptional regulator with PAS, ATPase and Fis domain